MADNAEPRWLTADELETWFAVAGLALMLPGALDSQLLEDSGLTFFEYLVLARLSESPDHTMQMSEIATAANGSLSRLSHAATRLEKRGLLTRTRTPGPGRRTMASLTADGLAAIEAAAPGHVRHVRALAFDGLSADDLAATRRVAQHVIAAINPERGAC